MKKPHKNTITYIEPGSIADEMGVVPGDILLSINFREINDIFDYHFLIKDNFIEILIEKATGEEWLLDIEKEDYEDIGMVFENGLMDDAKHCTNKCKFCFIDQLPKNMRKSLYFKDDDARLSFLQGNYITLTNMDEATFDRIIYYKFSPINISVHTTNMQQRAFMMDNPEAVFLFDYIDRLAKANIEMNFQIVLVKGLNDGSYLEKSISDLAEYIPYAKSLSIVPVGLTKYREGLYPIERFTKENARDIIGTVKKWQQSLRKTHDTRFVYAADEFYLLAGRDLPAYEDYQDFPQFENGVGMLAYFLKGAETAIRKPRLAKAIPDVTIVTSVAASEYMKSLCSEISLGFGVDIDICVVENKFFGENITTAGLLTGQDIIETLKKQKYHKKILIPKDALKKDEDIFLDDVTLADMQAQLKAEIIPTPNDGGAFVKEILG
ncbi:MAG: DUF512 domain-containing protein [Defluviitaleaceae bacterium]|nr:DUF512 domain-containing protein [Defluviitaleaceae bacterium]